MKQKQKERSRELFWIWPQRMLACGLKLDFHYGCAPWQPPDEPLQAKSGRWEAAQSGGEALLMLKPTERRAKEDRGTAVGMKD